MIYFTEERVFSKWSSSRSWIIIYYFLAELGKFTMNRDIRFTAASFTLKAPNFIIFKRFLIKDLAILLSMKYCIDYSGEFSFHPIIKFDWLSLIDFESSPSIVIVIYSYKIYISRQYFTGFSSNVVSNWHIDFVSFHSLSVFISVS